LLPALELHTGSNTYTSDLKPVWQWTGYESPTGATFLFGGLFGLLLGNFAVIANPLLWLSWILLFRHHYQGALFTSAAALVFAAQTLQLIVQPYRFDEAGAKLGYLATLRLGFVCWILSMAVILVASRTRRRS
jgi:hypothetical protein